MFREDVQVAALMTMSLAQWFLIRRPMLTVWDWSQVGGGVCFEYMSEMSPGVSNLVTLCEFRPDRNSGLGFSTVLVCCLSKEVIPNPSGLSEKKIYKNGTNKQTVKKSKSKGIRKTKYPDPVKKAKRKNNNQCRYERGLSTDRVHSS